MLVSRRKAIKLICLGSGVVVPIIAHRGFYGQKVEAAIPWLALISVFVTGVELVNSLFELGENLTGIYKLLNDSSETQEGDVLIQVYNISQPLEPEKETITPVKVLPSKEKSFELPPISFESSGERVLKVQTKLNNIGTQFSVGYFCCDSQGYKLCPAPLNLDLGTECLCPGQGVGHICR